VCCCRLDAVANARSRRSCARMRLRRLQETEIQVARGLRLPIGHTGLPLGHVCGWIVRNGRSGPTRGFRGQLRRAGVVSGSCSVKRSLGVNPRRVRARASPPPPASSTMKILRGPSRGNAVTPLRFHRRDLFECDIEYVYSRRRTVAGAQLERRVAPLIELPTRTKNSCRAAW